MVDERDSYDGKGEEHRMVKLKSTENSRFFYGYAIVIAGTLISLVMWGTRLSFSVLFAPVLTEFGWSRAVTAGGFSLTWVCCGLLSIWVGRMNDKIGPRIIMTVAGALLGLGYLLMSTMHSIWQLYLFYLIVSVGMSAAFVPIMSTIARWFFKMRALMTGIIMAGNGVALVTIVPMASQLTLNYGWREAYIIVGIICLVIIIAAAQFLKRDPGKVGKLPYGYDETKYTNANLQISGLTAKEAARTYQVYLIGAVYFSTYFVYWIIIVHLVIYALGTGIQPLQAAFIVSFIGIASAGGRILGGVFADRISPRTPMILGASLMIVALIWLLLAQDLWMFFLFGIIFGFGQGNLATMESPIVAHVYGIRSHGNILGLVFSMDNLGGALGPFLAGYIFDVTKSYTPAFAMCIIVAVICLAAVLLIKPIKKHIGIASDQIVS